jgi:hypothetical protein
MLGGLNAGRPNLNLMLTFSFSINGLKSSLIFGSPLKISVNSYGGLPCIKFVTSDLNAVNS